MNSADPTIQAIVENWLPMQTAPILSMPENRPIESRPLRTLNELLEALRDKGVDIDAVIFDTKIHVHLSIPN